MVLYLLGHTKTSRPHRRAGISVSHCLLLEQVFRPIKKFTVRKRITAREPHFETFPGYHKKRPVSYINKKTQRKSVSTSARRRPFLALSTNPSNVSPAGILDMSSERSTKSKKNKNSPSYQPSCPTTFISVVERTNTIDKNR